MVARFNEPVSEDLVLEGRRLSLAFEKRPGTWMYCNYPEKLPEDGSALGDADRGNRFLNQIVVDGEAQLFVSHFSLMQHSIRFGLQVYNPAPQPSAVVLERKGHRHTGHYSWCDVDGGTWQDFFASALDAVHEVGAGRAIWLLEEDVAESKFFHTLARFRTHSPLVCTAYVYADRAKIDGTASAYPFEEGKLEYRGHGESWFLSTSLNVAVSELPVHWLSHDVVQSPNEMISIVDPFSGRTFSSQERSNLGNWGAQYLYRVSLANDTQEVRTAHFFAGGGNKLAGFSGILYEGQFNYCCCEGQTGWRFLSDELQPGEEKTYSFQHIHLTNGYSPLGIQIKVD